MPSYISHAIMGNDLFNINYKFIQQDKMHGIVVGGNIRCFLKLAGTEYMPDMENKILFLESLNGDVAKIETAADGYAAIKSANKITR